MRLTVVLGASSEASFDVILNDNPFVQKWTKELQWCLDNCDLNQREAFASLLTLHEAAQILENACVIINKYLKNFIEIRLPFEDQTQEYFNYLHSKFEQLSGEFSKPTKLFSIAPVELKQAIRDLNFYLHRVETKKNSVPRLYINFNKDQYRRFKLEESDYDYFEFEIQPGTLFLHYAELGKDFFDLFEDDLPINYKGLKNLHFYSGEATLAFKKYVHLPDSEFFQWLINNNIDPYDKKLGHCKLPLGIVENIEDVKNKLSNYKYIKKIIIKE